MINGGYTLNLIGYSFSDLLNKLQIQVKYFHLIASNDNDKSF